MHPLASLTATVRTNRAQFYLKAATRRDPTHNARNYSRHAEIQFAPAQQAAVHARAAVICRTRASRVRLQLSVKKRLVQFVLAFGSDQPNNRLGGVQK